MKRTLPVLPVLLLLLLTSAAQAQYNFTTNAGSITITGYTGAGGDVTIPATITGLPVTGIGTSAFSGASLTGVTIPAGVTAIGMEAFFQCVDLSNVTIPDTVASIGSFAFSGCTSLAGAGIPASVTSIGDAAFQDCGSLGAIEVDAQNSFYRSVNGILFDRAQTTLVACPGDLGGSYAVPAGTISIGNYAFFHCAGLTNVTIPDGVAGIGLAAFQSCTSLGSLTIPGGATTIGDEAFQACTGLTNASLGVVNIGDYAFYGCTSLARAAISGGVTNIGDGAFGSCTSLAGIFFTGNAPTVGSAVFNSDDHASVYYLPATLGWSSTLDGLPALLWNPLMQAGNAGFGLLGDQFGFDITGTANIPVMVETAADLANPVWSPLQTVILTNGLFHFKEPFQSNSLGRFYRLAQP